MYLLHSRQRQTVIFTGTGIVLAVLMLIGVLVGFGVVPVPFFDDFASEPKVAQDGDVPCPYGDEKPVNPANIEVTILNASDTGGLAKDVAGELESTFGTQIKSYGNASEGSYDGTARITAGPAGVNAAYTIALMIPESEVFMDVRQTNDVTVTLGFSYKALATKETFETLAKQKLSPRQGCLPVSFN